MWAAEVRRAPYPLPRERTLSGWGRTSASVCRVLTPREEEQVGGALEGCAGGALPANAIARGAGLSYGDAAQNTGGAVIDMSALNRVLSIDPERGQLTAQAGVTIAQILSSLAPYGMTLPVVPGTRHVTLGGAIGSDIHGKNHHRDGGFARHVVRMSLQTPDGAVAEISPESDAELFYATLGGMGLTGVVTAATIRTEPQTAPWMEVDTDRTNTLHETLAKMGEEERHRYSVAWLDLLAGGSAFGRAVVSRADPLAATTTTPTVAPWRLAIQNHPERFTRRARWTVPERIPGALLAPAGVRAFNAAWWRAAPRHERARPVPLAPYFFPLDGVGNWNRLYGPAGLLQYQFVIPLGSESDLQRCFEVIRTQRLPVYLAVFKRFGSAFGGPLSFPIEGWTLALDIPAQAAGVRQTLDRLDEMVAGAGGRVYLAKDARLRPELLGAMYPQLERFRAIRRRVDPDGLLRSDLAARLGLCEAAA
jgi:decaprenylphospho-beta-D-ribofuranose 2-oxidase